MSTFPVNPSVGDIYNDYQWDGTVWRRVGGSLNDYATDVELAFHSEDTTNVHGISDTSALETQTGAQSKADAAESAANTYTDNAIASFEALPDQTGNSGKYLTTDGSTTSWDTVDVSGEIATHNADTTNVHGIADTSLLATTSYVDTAESDAVTTANAYSDSLASNYDPAGTATSEVSTHNSNTTSVHGIADTSALATKTYADNAAATAAAGIVDSAPTTLDTLNELAAALGDDPNFATTVTNSLAGKVSDTGDTMTGSLVVQDKVSAVFYENNATITGSYAITAGNNAMSAGPVTIATGSDVEIPSGSVWIIL